MNSLELLTEAVTGDITVGFELECIVPQDETDPSQMDGSIVGAISDAGYGVSDDSSIEPDFEDEEFGIEIDIGTVAGKFGEQRRISASPSDFAAVSKFVAFLFTNGAYVNESCGFHAHFGLGKLKSTDSMRNLWFACYFVKEGLFNRYSHYTIDPKEVEYNKTIPTFRVNDEGKKEATYSERAGIEQFDDTEYASFLSLEESVTEFENYLNELTSKEAKIEYAAKVAMNKLGTAGFEKYNLMNVHEQGTVEWRGLRFGSMYNHGDATLQMVGNYLKFVYKFARELARAYGILPNYEIGGITLTDIQRYFYQGRAKRSTTSKHLADAFRETFSALNVPKDVVHRSLQQFIKQVGTRSVNAAELFQDHTTAKKLITSIGTFASLATPFFKGADYTNISLLDTNIQVDKLRFLLEFSNLGFHGASFSISHKLWQKLVVQHGFSFVDCTFQQCTFDWGDPQYYAEYNPFYGFDQCTFIDCVFTFPTNEIHTRIETAGQQRDRGTPYGQWQRFMEEEDINSQSRENSVPVQEPDVEQTDESLVEQYKKDIQYLTEVPNVAAIQQRRNVTILRRAGLPEISITAQGHIADIEGNRLNRKQAKALAGKLKAQGKLTDMVETMLDWSPSQRAKHSVKINTQITFAGNVTEESVKKMDNALRRVGGAAKHNDYRKALQPAIDKGRKVLNLLDAQGLRGALLKALKYAPKGLKVAGLGLVAGGGGASATGVGIAAGLPAIAIGALIWIVGEMIDTTPAGEGSDIIPDPYGLKDAKATIDLAEDLAKQGKIDLAQDVFRINPPWTQNGADDQAQLAFKAITNAAEAAQADNELKQSIKTAEAELQKDEMNYQSDMATLSTEIGKINPDFIPGEEPGQPKPEPDTIEEPDEEPGEVPIGPPVIEPETEPDPDPEPEEEPVIDPEPEPKPIGPPLGNPWDDPYDYPTPEEEPVIEPEREPEPGDPDYEWPEYVPHINPPEIEPEPEDDPEPKPTEPDPKPEPDPVKGPDKIKPIPNPIPSPIWPFIDPYVDDPGKTEVPVEVEPVSPPRPEEEPWTEPEPVQYQAPKASTQVSPNIDPIVRPTPITQVQPLPPAKMSTYTPPPQGGEIVLPKPIFPGSLLPPEVSDDKEKKKGKEKEVKPITRQEIDPPPVIRSKLNQKPVSWMTDKNRGIGL